MKVAGVGFHGSLKILVNLRRFVGMDMTIYRLTRSHETLLTLSILFLCTPRTTRWSGHSGVFDFSNNCRIPQAALFVNPLVGTGQGNCTKIVQYLSLNFLNGFVLPDIAWFYTARLSSGDSAIWHFRTAKDLGLFCISNISGGFPPSVGTGCHRDPVLGLFFWKPLIFD
jgi:hypothetical protein